MNFRITPPQTDEWGALMARAQAGDGTAYRALLRAISPWLRQLASAGFRGRADVDDVVQDILLTLHAIRQTYDPSRPFRPWLVAVARRRIADRLRVEIRRRTRETCLQPEHETFAAPETNLMEDGSEARRLRQAVLQLPEAQRRAVTMLKLEEKSLVETAAATGHSVAALKVSSHRALTKLRKLLERT